MAWALIPKIFSKSCLFMSFFTTFPATRRWVNSRSFSSTRFPSTLSIDVFGILISILFYPFSFFSWLVLILVIVLLRVCDPRLMRRIEVLVHISKPDVCLKFIAARSLRRVGRTHRTKYTHGPINNPVSAHMVWTLNCWLAAIAEQCNHSINLRHISESK